MLFYLAHPVAADDFHGFNDNKAHTLKVLRLVHEAGIKVVCPWWTDLHAFDDADETERRERQSIQNELLPKCDGILLTGHRISSGMEAELKIMERRNRFCKDFTGVSDADLPEKLKEFAKEGAFYGRGIGWRD